MTRSEVKSNVDWTMENLDIAMHKEFAMDWKKTRIFGTRVIDGSSGTYMTITTINFPLREATKVINEPSASSNSKWPSFIYTEFFHLIKIYSINIRIVLNRLLNVRVQCFQIVFFLMR
jgi:hypothetical protein